MSDLKTQIQDWMRRGSELLRELQLDELAEAFMRGEREIKDGDYMLAWKEHPTRVHINEHTGKWMFDSREYHVPCKQEDHERLYTAEEVLAIIAKVRKL